MVYWEASSPVRNLATDAGGLYAVANSAGKHCRQILFPKGTETDGYDRARTLPKTVQQRTFMRRRCGSWDENQYTDVCGKCRNREEDCVPALSMRRIVFGGIQRPPAEVREHKTVYIRFGFV
jgi:hypothetical protein